MKLLPYHDQFFPNSQVQVSDDVPVDLVLIHGWGLHSQIWDDIVPNLLDRNFKLTLIDLPGMGRSPMSNKVQTLDTMVDAILPCMPEKTLLMGWSLGGLVAAKYAQRFPSRVSGLVNIAMGPCFTKQQSWTHGMDASLLEEFMSWFEEDWQGTLVRFLALQCKNSSQQRKILHTLKSLVYFHGLPNHRGLRDGLDILCQSNFVEFYSHLSDVDIPALFLLGKNDEIVSAASAEAIKSLSNMIDVEVLENSAHIPFLDNTEEFLAAFFNWASRFNHQGQSRCV